MQHSQSGMNHSLSRHTLIMILCCLIPMVAIVVITAFGFSLTGVLRYALILICPLGFVLMMFIMMRGDHSHATAAGEGETGQQEKGASCH